MGSVVFWPKSLDTKCHMLRFLILLNLVVFLALPGRAQTPETGEETAIEGELSEEEQEEETCLLYTSPSPRDATLSRMPSSA